MHGRKRYDREAATILWHLGQPPRNGRLIDWGCGTGEFIARFSSAGWQVQGYDISPYMVREAQQKGIAAEPGDICQPPVGIRPVAAQTCLFAAFSYATAGGDREINAALKTFRKSGAPGSRIVFDFVNADAEFRPQHVDFFRDVDGVQFRRTQRKRFDLESRILTISVDFAASNEAQQPIGENWSECHELRCFSQPEIRRLLAAAGLCSLAMFDLERPGQPVTPQSYYITVVAKVV